MDAHKPGAKNARLRLNKFSTTNTKNISLVLETGSMKVKLTAFKRKQSGKIIEVNTVLKNVFNVLHHSLEEETRR